MATNPLDSVVLDEAEFIGLLDKIIGETEFLQDSPPEFIPKENLVVGHVLSFLKPFTKEEGGRLEVEHVTYVEGRGNLIIRLPGTGDGIMSFIGSHMDVVPANPETWERNPFKLSVEGDKLYGRGTTDCLGHVVLTCCLLAAICRQNIQLEKTFVVVFIASEEAGMPGVGVDALMANGKIEDLKAGPILWMDCADSQPCIGTAAALDWKMHFQGKLFHSGLPHKGINSLELAFETVSRIQDRFYQDFPPHPQEEVYKFTTCSTMKPTQMTCAKGGINQIPPSCTVSGDIRLTPFYDRAVVQAKVEEYIRDINANLGQLSTRGPVSKFELPDENLKGSIRMEWGSLSIGGIACDLESPLYRQLCNAVEAVKGKAEPFSICGSLPIVHEMRASGYDIQLIGFGLMSTYHADNEYCLLSDMKDAMLIMGKILHGMNA
jgi:acetylornithine deacetylase